MKILKLSLIIFLVFFASCEKYQKPPNKVKLLVEQNKYEEAIKEAENEKDDKIRFNYLGIIYSKKGDLKKSEEYYKKVLKLDAKNLKASYNLALLKLNTKKFKEALIILKSLTKNYPKSIDVKIKLAFANYALSINSNAIYILKSLVEKRRKDLTLLQWEEIGGIYTKLNRFQAAAEALEYYISKAQKDNLKIDLDKTKKLIKLLRSKRNQEL